MKQEVFYNIFILNFFYTFLMMYSNKIKRYNIPVMNINIYILYICIYTASQFIARNILNALLKATIYTIFSLVIRNQFVK